MSTPPLVSGAVVSEDVRASRIGTSMLAQGGSAADAVIATTLALNVFQPHRADMGGGGFALIRRPDGEYEGLDFRQCAPRLATPDYFQTHSTSTGGGSVAVPGQMRGLEEIHRRWGKLPWRNVVEPARKLAHEGFEMSSDLHRYICTIAGGSDSVDAMPDWFRSSEEHRIFHDGQKILPPKHIIHRRELGKTLDILADHGAGAFYEGQIAEGLVDAVQNKEGVMTLEDLRDYKIRFISPKWIDYRDHRVYSFPAPASGAVFMSALGVLGTMPPSPPGSVQEAHRTTEALKLAYGHRTLLGDPSFVPALDQLQDSWIQSSSLKARAGKINESQVFPPEHYAPDSFVRHVDQSDKLKQLVDSTGLVFSLTTTIGLLFGSKIIVPGYGFSLNDSMDDFSVQGLINGFDYAPSEANYVVGGKRPLSSSCPYIVEKDGLPILAGGGAGGSRIISGCTQIVRNILDHNMTAADALRAPRLHDQLSPNETLMEEIWETSDFRVEGFDEGRFSNMANLGHNVVRTKAIRNCLCAMKFTSDTWELAGEFRLADSGGDIFTAPG